MGYLGIARGSEEEGPICAPVKVNNSLDLAVRSIRCGPECTILISQEGRLICTGRNVDNRFGELGRHVENQFVVLDFHDRYRVRDVGFLGSNKLVALASDGDGKHLVLDIGKQKPIQYEYISEDADIVRSGHGGCCVVASKKCGSAFLYQSRSDRAAEEKGTAAEANRIAFQELTLPGSSELDLNQVKNKMKDVDVSADGYLAILYS